MSASPDAAAWPWPDSLDAVAAAPAHHLVLLENATVRVLDTRIAPGDIVPLHTHQWPCVIYVLSWSDILRRDGDGTVMLDTRVTPMTPTSAMWSAPLPPHTLENVGASEIHIISVELKSQTS
jgi:quercetin dioxygenase-like cupin family protein